MNNRIEELRKLNQELEVAKLNRDHRIEDKLQELQNKLNEKKDVIVYIIDTYNAISKYTTYIRVDLENFGKYRCVEMSVYDDHIYLTYNYDFSGGNEHINLRKDLSIKRVWGKDEIELDYVKNPANITFLSMIIDNLDKLKESVDNDVDRIIELTKNKIDETNADAKYGGM